MRKHRRTIKCLLAALVFLLAAVFLAYYALCISYAWIGVSWLWLWPLSWSWRCAVWRSRMPLIM